MTTAVLEVTDLSVRFGGLTAVDGMSLRLQPGETLALIGPNGAGKSTFVNAVTGYCASATGTVTFAGEAFSNRSVHARSRAGLMRTFQNLELFGSMTVRDNLRVALEASAGQRRARRNLDQNAMITDVAARLGLTESLDEPVGDLSYGVRKLAEFGRAFVSQPKVLLLDEPAAGLTAEAKNLLVAAVQDWRSATGGACILIEHDMSFIAELADRVIVMELGGLLAEGTYHEVSNNPDVVKAYLGSASSYSSTDRGAP